MAYIVFDPEASSLCEPSYLCAANKVEFGLFPRPSVPNAQRNLRNAFEEDASLMLPKPSAKDTVRSEPSFRCRGICLR